MRLLILGFLPFVFSIAVNAGTQLKFARGSIALKNYQAKFTYAPTYYSANNYFIVQFLHSPGPAERSLLESKGIRIIRYLPEDAYIVKAKPEQLSGVNGVHKGVYAIFPYRGDFKLSAGFPVISVFNVDSSKPVLVTAFSKEDVDNIENSLKSNPKVEILERSGRYLAMQTDLRTVTLLNERDDVEFIQELPQFRTMDFDPEDLFDPRSGGDYTDLTGYETGMKLMQFEKAWAKGFSGAGQVVAMADSGVDSGNVRTLMGDLHTAVLSGKAYGIGALDWKDPVGHGTHVAGSIVGRGTLSGGLLKGGAHSAKLVVQGMYSPKIKTLLIPLNYTDMFEDAFQEGARVHSNSWGSPLDLGAYDVYAQMADEYMWNNPEMLVVFAAGNSGVDADQDGVVDPGSITSPGTAKNVLTVGASKNFLARGGVQARLKDSRAGRTNWPSEPLASTRLSDNPKGLAPFSSRGPTNDGRLKPDIVAPGTNILSLRSQEYGAEELWGAYNDFYTFGGGTSMSAPLTAGAATVAREVLIRTYNISRPSAALVKAFLMNTAFDLYPGQFGKGPAQEIGLRPNSDEGYGRVDMAAVVNPNGKISFVDDTQGLTLGAAVEKTVAMAAGQKCWINLVYTDEPGSPAVKTQLVNNLELEVLDASGAILVGTKDAINNSKYLEFKAAKKGSYTIRVLGKQVPSASQPFALVYTVN